MIYHSIFSILIFENIITLCHVDQCLKFVGFLRDIMEDNKNNDRLYYLKKDGRKKEKMNLNVLFMRINSNLIIEAQGGINMCGGKNYLD